MNRAIFLDRDGVLDDLVHYAEGWGAPRKPSDVHLRAGVREALERAAKNGWMIFVISNQPDAAKGFTTMASLQAVHLELLKQLGNAPIGEFFYCFHRSEDRCECRKPEPFFVLQAARKYDIDLAESWFVGDTDTDIEAGRRAGTRTALLEYEHSISKRGAQKPNLVCRDLDHFVRTLVGRTSLHGPQSKD
ncbi:MAG TPA: HAD-IIIA family hydrolase [Thermoanaerobaculia bacterium]